MNKREVEVRVSTRHYRACGEQRRRYIKLQAGGWLCRGTWRGRRSGKEGSEDHDAHVILDSHCSIPRGFSIVDCSIINSWSGPQACCHNCCSIPHASGFLTSPHVQNPTVVSMC